jgi:hypothetical protein
VRIEYYTTTRDRVCKLCGNPIARGERGIVMKQIHVSPKVVDLHFCEKCFKEEIKELK